MTSFETGCLFLGIFLMSLCVARVRDWPPFRLTKKRIDVRIDSEWMTEQRQHDRLAAAADPFHYRAGPKGSRPGYTKGFDR